MKISVLATAFEHKISDLFPLFSPNSPAYIFTVTTADPMHEICFIRSATNFPKKVPRTSQMTCYNPKANLDAEESSHLSGSHENQEQQNIRLYESLHDSSERIQRLAGLFFSLRKLGRRKIFFPCTKSSCFLTLAVQRPSTRIAYVSLPTSCKTVQAGIP